MTGQDNDLKRLQAKLHSKEYRESYVENHVRRWLAAQIRILREQEGRNWTQKNLAAKLGKPQSAVSRLEDPDYGKMTVSTLLELAAAFDVALAVRFVDFPCFVEMTRDLSRSAGEVSSVC